MKNLSLKLMVMLWVVGLAVSTLALHPALAKAPIELSLVHFAPALGPEVKLVNDLFVKRVNEKAKGRLRIINRGGPEVMNPFDMPLAVQQGTVDMTDHVINFMANQVPGIELYRATELTPQQLRENGAFDYQRKMFAKAGFYLLGNAGPSDTPFFNMLTKIKLEKPEDFKGKRVAGTPPFFPFFKALGMVPTPVSTLKDYYPLMERGIIDAHIGSYNTSLIFGTCDLAKYLIDNTYWTQSQVLVMNLKKWESLPTDLQDLLNQCMAEFEAEYVPVWNGIIAKQKQVLRNKGVELYNLSPDVAKWYLSAAYDSAWQEGAKRYQADMVKELKALLRP
jgi:TRAP-type C4-dicarboxylate transport system substrate-binding protein